MKKNKKFEHLFSLDPIGAFTKIEEDYIRYFKAAFKLKKNKNLDDKRIKELKKGDVMSKKPYIELLPEYSPAVNVKSFDDLADKFSHAFGDKSIALTFFNDFIAKGLMNYLPYGHQVGMMEKAFAGMDERGNNLKYKNTVITSGTGSGKTESFLLPLLADIFKETKSWRPIEIDHKNWFKGVTETETTRRGNTNIFQRYTPCQREGDPRPAAIRALLIYPMNALVEDQMARLREALDCDEVRSFMDSHLNGNRIYFGSYKGSTIAPKSYDIIMSNNKQGIRENVVKELEEIHKNYMSICRYIEQDPDGKKDAQYVSPRLGEDEQSLTSEMITRWDMQKWAPDILITNTSMLSIMLMREAEEQIFEDTRKWLAAEDLPENEREEAKKGRVFHIVVDELHLYRGTAGSEVACLLRMLYNALGLRPVVPVIIDGKEYKIPNPQIKILASSASLGDEEQTEKFMEEFFGIYSTIEGEKVFNIQSGSNYNGEDKTLELDYTKFSFFTHDNFVALDIDADTPEKKDEVAMQRLERINKFVQDEFNVTDICKFIDKYQEQIFYDFYSLLPTNEDNENNEKKSRRPIAQDDLVEKRFGGNEDALRGFLIFRGYIDEAYIRDEEGNEEKVVKKHKLPRFRFHKFFKYIEGMWGELQPSIPSKDKNNDPVSDLSYTAEEIGIHNRKVLELLRCENCGELFIGGNRKDNDDGTISLTLNYPLLDQIPNFNPTPMVQNKNYRDYAIFWPHDTNHKIDLETNRPVNQGAEDHVVNIFNGDTTYANGKATWIPGYLDSLTGQFTPKEESAPNGQLKENLRKNGVEGFLYRVNNNNTSTEITQEEQSKIFAAPCTCPYCSQNYTNRKYTNSPIRSFRTGIDRSNQILSKELLYQLDEKSAKLIGFSDSREDAAKQAYGIEKEQYRDMVRMLFVECVEECNKDIEELEAFVKQKLSEGENNLNILSSAINKFNRINNHVDIVMSLIAGEDISCYKTSTIPLSNFIGVRNNLDGSLVRKLLGHGINPAGASYKFQWYTDGDTGNIKHWSTAYDFENYSLRGNVTFRTTDMQNQIRVELTNAIFSNSFGKYMGVSTLDSGIGYICCNRSEQITNSDEFKNLRELLPQDVDVYEFVDAFIRVMGDNYLYPSNEFYGDQPTEYEDLKAAVKRIIRKFAEKHKKNEIDLGNTLCKFLKKHCCIGNGNDTRLLLDIEKLSFKRMTDSEYPVCKVCERVHPNKGFGFCTSCRKDFDDKKIPIDELHKHYISHDLLIEKREPRKLHTEELSGQTDDIQSRLHEFKELIFEEIEDYKQGKEKTLPIDMICVTTTMEVGVDIGSLQAIFQGNMPPTRYNYQQRVGRGGRRGQAFSTAFTFCRGRSHDVYYYEKATEEIIGGIPATPTLSLAPYSDNGKKRMKMAIMKRVIVKELLHQTYKDLDYDYFLNDTAGEFGRVGEWDTSNNGKTNKERLSDWLKENSSFVNDTVHRYIDQFNLNGEVDEDIENIKNWVNEELVDQIDRVVQKTSVKDKGLAEYLTESGFLPMYGMPSDARQFYHGFNHEKNTIRSIDRSSEMAISEFAPGSEKTKDKGKYRIEGITIPITEDATNFFDQNGDALSDCYVLSMEHDIISNVNNNIKDISPYDSNITLNDKQRKIVIPQAYRSLKIESNTGTPIENNDRGSRFIQTEIFAKESSSDSGQSKEERNVRITMFELGRNEDPTIWHVNHNNGLFYTGSYNARGIDSPYGNNNNFMFYDEQTQNGKTTISPKERGNNTQEIAIGSKKVTEMVKLELIDYDSDKLNLSLKKGNKSAIRAAFYSAAYLLQRALADKLDVQPEEIEISEKIDDNHDYPIIYLSDALPNGAGIVSYLYKEGNLEKLITQIINFESFDKEKTSKEKSFMQSLIAEEHRGKCLTACQKCLLTYNNRGFHHVLDWRMGVGVLRLMYNKDYDFGYDKDSRDNYEEFSDWNKILKACADKLRLETKNDGQYYWEEKQKIIYHPLWNREKVIEGIDKQIEMYNTFKVLRSDLSVDYTKPGERTGRFSSSQSQATTTETTDDVDLE